ncbi:FtsW/RodA/SpoVE family cell cycle protein [Kytococcus aerolatus]|uniref:FtsW/RodA/SpoVE family cell cycle protein n=1 Tax=Kytococcus aerolatus TaxID=592308 RepID=UPI000B5967FD
MTTASSARADERWLAPRRGRWRELLLLAAAIGITALAYLNLNLATTGAPPENMATLAGGMAGIALLFHLVLWWRARYADPVILPVVTLLNGLGLVMLHRLDIAEGRSLGAGVASRQLMWTALAVVVAMAVLVLLRDHRVLRRVTWTCALLGFVLLLSPLVPGLGVANYGSRIWIGIGPFSFQPGEVAKILLTIFFAGYLVGARDALSTAGPRLLGLQLPRGRDLGPILMVWVLSILILVFEKDLGSSLLFFGLFVAMLYVATERLSWVLLGLTMFAGGAVLAWRLFGHVQQRVTMWLDPFSPEALSVSNQVPLGLMGMANGGLLGTGLGRGRPDLTYFAESDFIMPSFAEELGLAGFMAMVVLYGILVQRGLRVALGSRDGFGTLLAAGLSFSVALQVFVVVGGVTRVIPLTGLTTPFLSAGGSSLLANWTIAALLLRLSHDARAPIPLDDEPTPTGDSPAARAAALQRGTPAAESGRAHGTGPQASPRVVMA